jgi:hypothetical protein
MFYVVILSASILYMPDDTFDRSRNMSQYIYSTILLNTTVIVP